MVWLLSGKMKSPRFEFVFMKMVNCLSIALVTPAGLTQPRVPEQPPPSLIFL
jgi:hypothetical protein